MKVFFSDFFLRNTGNSASDSRHKALKKHPADSGVFVLFTKQVYNKIVEDNNNKHLDMFEKWKAKFIASQEAKNQAARAELEEAKKQMNEAELELEQANKEYNDLLAAGDTDRAEQIEKIKKIKEQGEVRMRARQESARAEREKEESEIERLKREIAGLEQEIKSHEKS